MFESAVTRFREWIKTPFKADGDPFDWFLFLGFALLMIAVWKSIFKTFEAFSE